MHKFTSITPDDFIVLLCAIIIIIIIVTNIVNIVICPQQPSEINKGCLESSAASLKYSTLNKESTWIKCMHALVFYFPLNPQYYNCLRLKTISCLQYHTMRFGEEIHRISEPEAEVPGSNPSGAGWSQKCCNLSCRGTSSTVSPGRGC